MEIENQKQDINNSEDYNLGFSAGKKWQAERMYTEEDLGKAFYAGANYQDGIYEEGFQNSRPTFEEWFELFKKNRHEKE